MQPKKKMLSNLLRTDGMVDMVVIHDPSARENPDEVEFCESVAAAHERAESLLVDATNQGYAIDVYVCRASMSGSVRAPEKKKP